MAHPTMIAVNAIFARIPLSRVMGFGIVPNQERRKRMMHPKMAATITLKNM